SLFMFACFGGKKVYTVDESTKEKLTTMDNLKSIYDFKVETISGDTLDLATLKGKKVLIVNTASKCGLTPQFEQLEAWCRHDRDQAVGIVGFPSHDFMGQDAGTNEEIAECCQLDYGVSFPLMAKVVVKGKDKHPLYQYLTEKAR